MGLARWLGSIFGQDRNGAYEHLVNARTKKAKANRRGNLVPLEVSLHSSRHMVGSLVAKHVLLQALFGLTGRRAAVTGLAPVLHRVCIIA